jgi:hypothetical protein
MENSTNHIKKSLKNSKSTKKIERSNLSAKMAGEVFAYLLQVIPHFF